MSIQVQNITKIYGEQKALDNVSFEVGKGEVVGFLGPNGAGKSTMMKIITCFISPSSGQVKVCGYGIDSDSINVRKKIGYLPENTPLYLDMYVKEYLAFIAGLHKLSNKKDRVTEIIETVGLQIEQKKKIGALSKGFRQRVGLAQALIHDPEVLIFDEPTSGLDPNQLEDIRTLIRDIGKEKTVMLSTHIMQEVEAVCDRIIIINNGTLVADDTTSGIYNEVADDNVVSVEFNARVDTSELKAIVGVLEVKQFSDTNFLIKAETNKDIREDIFQLAVDKGISVLSLQKESQSLEEVFKKLTR